MRVSFSAFAAAVGLMALGGGLEAFAAKPIDYGTEPVNADARAKAAIIDIAVDPESVRFGPTSTQRQASLSEGWKTTYGYVVCIDVSAKNRMGGGGRFETWGVFFRDGVVIEVVDKRYSQTVLEKLCPGARM